VGFKEGIFEGKNYCYCATPLVRIQHPAEICRIKWEQDCTCSRKQNYPVTRYNAILNPLEVVQKLPLNLNKVWMGPIASKN